MMKPIVVCDPGGTPILALTQNAKGHKKSLERNELWALHPETERLLPVFPGVPVTITEQDHWYKATLATSPVEGPFGETDAGSDGSEPAPSGGPGTRLDAGSGPAQTADHAASSSGADAPTQAAGIATSGGASGDGDVASGASHGNADGAQSLGRVLSDLVAIISQRHRDLPEGSYTTHLFSSGSDKIRKKFGEEAVELLLAHDREHIVSETSDLIYHLLVLLESEGIPVDEIARELDKR